MQPGLRRVAPGSRQLTPSPNGRPASATRRSQCWPARRRRALAAVDPGSMHCPCCRRSPRKHRWKKRRPSCAGAPPDSARHGSAGPSTTTSCAAKAILRSEGSSHRCRPRSERRPCSAWRSKRTSPSSTATTRRSRGWPCACPRAGHPKKRSGFTSPRCIPRWPTTCLARRRPSEQLARLVTGRDRWERIVWTVTPDPRLQQHPARGLEPWSASADEEAIGAQARVSPRVPVLHSAAVRTPRGVHDPHRKRAARERAAITRRRVDAACRVSSMSPSVLVYRGLDAVREPLLAWLARRVDDLPARAP